MLLCKIVWFDMLLKSTDTIKSITQRNLQLATCLTGCFNANFHTKLCHLETYYF